MDVMLTCKNATKIECSFSSCPNRFLLSHNLGQYSTRWEGNHTAHSLQVVIHEKKSHWNKRDNAIRPTQLAEIS